jgi:hypothetical protein
MYNDAYSYDDATWISTNWISTQGIRRQQDLCDSYFQHIECVLLRFPCLCDYTWNYATSETALAENIAAVAAIIYMENAANTVVKDLRFWHSQAK